MYFLLILRLSFRCSGSSVTILMLTAYELGQRLGVSQQLVVRITGSVLMTPNKDPNKPAPASDDFRSKINIGLNLRINKKMEEVRRSLNWRVVSLFDSYFVLFGKIDKSNYIRGHEYRWTFI
jgi:hypothetical protein